MIIEDFLSSDEVEELKAAGRALCMDAPKESRNIFTAVSSMEENAAQNKDNYFIESGNKIRYFFEAGALGKDGELLVDPLSALNKVGYGGLNWFYIKNEFFFFFKRLDMHFILNIRSLIKLRLATE